MFAQNNNSLEIETNSSLSQIWVNDEYFGMEKIKLSNLRDGEYYITIVESARGWNSDDIRDTVLLSGNITVSRKYKFDSKVYLKSNPNDAKVINTNGEVLGYTPLQLSLFSEDLILQKKNYESIELNILKANFKYQLDFLGEKESAEFSDGNWFKILVGSAVIFGAVAAYYKIQADQEYDKYLINKNKKHLNAVDRYDLYSGIAFGALQINFGYLIYKFLSED